MQKQLSVVDAKLLDVETGLPEVHSFPRKGEPSVVEDVENEQTKEKKENRSYMRRVVCSKSSLWMVLLFLVAFTSYLVWQMPRRRNREIVEITDYTDSIAYQSVANNKFSTEEPSENANVVSEIRCDYPINDSIIQDSDEDISNIEFGEAIAEAVEAAEEFDNYLNVAPLIDGKRKANRILSQIWLRSQGVPEEYLKKHGDETLFRVVRKFIRRL
ncbi:uncharacterized protein LOC143362701 [Halictus rubicundus]|uniref:uncharacterized protein LOC143362701 n=1 Tax=Halictus rubicundus TaxID=77578 RepID=UPI0040372913